MRAKRDFLTYTLLALGWIVFCGWQVVEHSRTRSDAEDALRLRSRDISDVFSVTISALSREFGFSRARLEAALEELVKVQKVTSVVLLSTEEEYITSVGEALDWTPDDLSSGGEWWNPDAEALVVANLVELGFDIPEEERRLRPPWGRRGRGPGDRGGDRGGDKGGETAERPARSDGDGGGRKGGRGDGPRGGHPSWVSEEVWAEFQKRTVQLDQSFFLLLQLDTSAMGLEIANDLWMRIALMAFALAASLGIGGAWRGASRSFVLEVRLARAQEMNINLRELNLAAAGLAHETRNPLNLVRGMAQIVAKESPEDSEVHDKANSIVEEVDRVASRLNEFIDYSKPREAKLAPTNLTALINEVWDTLKTDLEDREIEFALEGPDLTIEADEALFRQTIFNLLLNALQAVDVGGRVTVAVNWSSAKEAWLDVRDNGPGVSAEHRESIFQPYFTTREEGTGLGLAVVRQIVLAHHWEIEYLNGEDGLSIFRIKGMKVV